MSEEVKQIEKIIKYLIELNELGVSENEIIKRYEEKILSLKNVKLSSFFAETVKGADVKALEKAVLESKDPEWNFCFVDVKGADVKAHEKVVIESKDPEWNFKFAEDVEGADVKVLEKVVIESKNSFWNYMFADYIEGADVKAHGKVIIESKKLMDNYWFNDVLRKKFEDEYKFLSRNALIFYYNFMDDVLDEMMEKNNEENKSMQKRF